MRQLSLFVVGSRIGKTWIGWDSAVVGLVEKLGAVNQMQLNAAAAAKQVCKTATKMAASPLAEASVLVHPLTFHRDHPKLVAYEHL